MGCAPSSERGWRRGEVACGCFGCPSCTGCTRSLGCGSCVGTGDIGCFGCATCVSCGNACAASCMGACGGSCGRGCGSSCTTFCNGCQASWDSVCGGCMACAGCAAGGACCAAQGQRPSTVEYGDASTAVPIPGVSGLFSELSVVLFESDRTLHFVVYKCRAGFSCLSHTVYIIHFLSSVLSYSIAIDSTMSCHSRVTSCIHSTAGVA